MGRLWRREKWEPLSWNDDDKPVTRREFSMRGREKLKQLYQTIKTVAFYTTKEISFDIMIYRGIIKKEKENRY